MSERFVVATNEVGGVLLPRTPTTVEQLGVGAGIVLDLALKTLFQYGQRRGKELAEQLCINHNALFEVMVEARNRKLCELQGSSASYETLWVYALSQAGRDHVARVMERDQYFGAVPVSLEHSNEMVKRQSVTGRKVTLPDIRELFKDLVLGDDLIKQFGPACNSGQSIFLYGHPGNGKTLLARQLSRLVDRPIVIPKAIEADGQVIKLFDPGVHKVVSPSDFGIGDTDLREFDTRWVLIERPFVVVGGELMMHHLDIAFDDKLKYYTAPLQMMANGGIFLIDDFGRQRVSPQEILNRWIVPLENRVDFFTLVTGRQIVVPFDVLLVLSTNLAPQDLVDEAFLRRIRFKIEVRNPTEAQFKEIFRRMCAARGVEYNDAMITYLINYHYFESGRELRSCHPRDLLDQMVELASFEGAPLTLNSDLIDAACRTYFIES